VPALIAGFFSVAPKLYDILSSPRAALSYTETSGPAINAAGNFRRIFSFTIENSGKLPLTGIDFEIKPPFGAQIESHTIESSGALPPIIPSSDDSFRAHIERMLPTETVSVSLMTISNTSDTRLTIAVRSNEVLGALKAAAAQSRPVETIISALVAALGAALSMFVFFDFVRRRGGRMTGLLPGYREDKIKYIALLSGVSSLPENVLNGEREQLTYIGAGDLFLSAGLRGDANVRQRCVLALKALLAADPYTRSESLKAIRIQSRVVRLCTVRPRIS
jgi:hypothetical protein